MPDAQPESCLDELTERLALLYAELLRLADEVDPVAAAAFTTITRWPTMSALSPLDVRCTS